MAKHFSKIIKGFNKIIADCDKRGAELTTNIDVQNANIEHAKEVKKEATLELKQTTNLSKKINELLGD